ncbi:MAG: hypothetical protein ACR5LA_09635 [Wolbachia sp.]
MLNNKRTNISSNDNIKSVISTDKAKFAYADNVLGNIEEEVVIPILIVGHANRRHCRVA